MISYELQFFGGRGSSGGKGKGGGGSASKQEVLQKIDNLSHGEHPIPLTQNNDEVMEVIINLDDKDLKKAKPMEVSISNLVTIQPHIDHDELRSKVEKYGVEGAITSKGYSNAGITAVKIGKEYVIIDGNHRAAIAKLANKDKIKIKVLKR